MYRDTIANIGGGFLIASVFWFPVLWYAHDLGTAAVVALAIATVGLLCLAYGTAGAE